MRPIKFRARNAEVPSCWIYGYFVVERGCHYIINDEGKFKVICDTEGQYTGPKDSKNREIYEGDVLGSVGCEEVEIDGIVKWMNDRGAYYLVDEHGYVTDSDYCYEGLDWNKLEIVSNIYENPELLEAKKCGGEKQDQ